MYKNKTKELELIFTKNEFKETTYAGNAHVNRKPVFTSTTETK